MFILLSFVFFWQHYVIKFINDLRFFRSHKSSRHISVNGRNWESCFITNLILVLLFCGGDVVLFSEMFEDTKVVTLLFFLKYALLLSE
jgi:hypothetical protein